MNKDELKRMHTLCNGFANERQKEFTDQLCTACEEMDNNEPFRDAVRKIIGRALATAYAKGFGDCHEAIKPKKLFI